MELADINGRSQYAWADWLDGRCWYLHAQADFLCTIPSIQSQAHTWARKVEVEVCTRNVDSGVLVQAYPVGSTWKPNLAAITTARLRKVIENKR